MSWLIEDWTEARFCVSWLALLAIKPAWVIALSSSKDKLPILLNSVCMLVKELLLIEVNKVGEELEPVLWASRVVVDLVIFEIFVGCYRTALPFWVNC